VQPTGCLCGSVQQCASDTKRTPSGVQLSVSCAAQTASTMMTPALKAPKLKEVLSTGGLPNGQHRYDVGLGYEMVDFDVTPAKKDRDG
jgi:hypothetical protein